MRELEGKSAIITGGVVLNWSTGRSGYWADRVTVCGKAKCCAVESRSAD
jgi:hypothetical protein